MTAAEAQGSTGRRKVTPIKRRQVTGQLYGDKFNQGDAFDRGNFFFIKTSVSAVSSKLLKLL